VAFEWERPWKDSKPSFIFCEPSAFTSREFDEGFGSSFIFQQQLFKWDLVVAGT
jgi:hypothetical protein